MLKSIWYSHPVITETVFLLRLSLKRLKKWSTDSNRKTAETIQVKRIKREFVWSLKHWNNYPSSEHE